MRWSMAWLVGGCAQDGAPPPPSLSPAELEPMERQSVGLSGGGLAVGHDWAGGADPDSDVVKVVHTLSLEERVVPLAAGWAPTAIAWTSWEEGEELLHVLSRGNGTISVIAPGADVDGTATLRNVQPICPAPRGLAWGQSRMWVVCAGGELVWVDRDGTIGDTVWLDPDLRDIVILADGRALVSRMRAAEVLVVNLSLGTVTARFTPPARVHPGTDHPLIPRVLRRMVPYPDGTGAAVAYQLHDDGPLNNNTPSGVPEYYGSVFNPCSGLVHPVVGKVDPDTGFGEEQILDGMLIVDLAVDDPGQIPLVALPDRTITEYTLSDLDEDHTCATEAALLDGAFGLTTSIAIADGEVWRATRQPFVVGPVSDWGLMEVDAAPFLPTPGLALFHAAPQGIACASCHPDGGDDAHTWTFVPEGPRRTQSMAGIIMSQTAPFHWDGSLSTFADLFVDVGVTRMGLSAKSDTHTLLEYIDDLARPPISGRPPDPDLAAEGEILFGDETVGCASCHSGWRYSNGENADVGTGGTFQVPPLLGVEARLPVMHDGCALTLRQRFDDPVCGGGDRHGVTSHLDDHQIDALVAFLQTL